MPTGSISKAAEAGTANWGGQIKDVLFVVVFGCVFLLSRAGSDVARAVWAARFQHWIQYTTALCLAGHNQR